MIDGLSFRTIIAAVLTAEVISTVAWLIIRHVRGMSHGNDGYPHAGS